MPRRIFGVGAGVTTTSLTPRYRNVIDKRGRDYTKSFKDLSTENVFEHRAGYACNLTSNTIGRHKCAMRAEPRDYGVLISKTVDDAVFSFRRTTFKNEWLAKKGCSSNCDANWTCGLCICSPTLGQPQSESGHLFEKVISDL